ncbi:hypothetical protein ACGFJC_53850 [Nonomuraea fuscirosea]
MEVCHLAGTTALATVPELRVRMARGHMLTRPGRFEPEPARKEVCHDP